MCENCHCQNSIGGEVEEAETVGVHNIAEKLRERRAEPTVEEQGEERISIWSHFPINSWKYPRARMRSRLCRPEEVVILPQLLRGKFGGKIARSFRSAASRCASADFTPFPLSAFGAMAEVVGEIDGVGGAGGNEERSAALFRLWEEGESGGFFRDWKRQSARWANCPCFPCL